MIFKQLEYFIKVAEVGSINKAAEALFTSQPNVSKIINSFEKECNGKLFKRTAKGVILTEKGQELYDYASRVVCNINIINSIIKRDTNNKLKISSYPSYMISRVLSDYYKKYEEENINIEFLQGNVEEIIEHVKVNQSDIGIIYISSNQICCLNQILSHKNIEFKLLDKKNPCIYVGKNNKLYSRKSIRIDELSSLKFVQSTKDFFSMDQYLQDMCNKTNNLGSINNTIITNSNHVMIDFLITSNLCSFGINLINKDYERYDIKSLEIEDYDNKLLIGYIKRKNEKLSYESSKFIEILKEKIIDNNN